MKVKRYSSIYRNEHRGLKIVLMAVAVLALIVAGFFLASLFSGNDDTQSGLSSSDTSVPTSDTASDTVSDTSSEPEVTVIQREGAIRVAFLPATIAADSQKLSAFIEEAKAAGITDVVLTIKDTTGYLYFDSNYEPVKNIKNRSENMYDMAAAVKALHDGGLKAVAKLNCFSDRLATRIKNAGVLYSENHNVVWLDDEKANGGKSWLNPYSEEARAYLTYLADEAVDMGFDVIMLDSVRFPGGYQLYAYYGDNLSSREDCLGGFVTEMKNHLSEKDTEMWLYASTVAYVDPTTEIYTSNVFNLGADVVLFDAMPKNYPTKLAFGEVQIEKPVQNPKQTVTALIQLAQSHLENGSDVRLVPVLQAYTDSTINSEYNLTYTNETLNLQFEALNETALTDYAVYSDTGSLELLK